MSQDSLTVTGSNATRVINILTAGQREANRRTFEIPESADGSPITLSQVLEHNNIVNDTDTVYRSRGNVVRDTDVVEENQTLVASTNVSAG